MKKRTLTSFLLIISFLLSSNVLFAQQIEVKGKVFNIKGKPIKATVLAKGSKNEIVTDKNGLFTIICNSKDKLKVTADDYYSKTIKVKGNKYFEVKLKKSGIDYSEYPTFKKIMTSAFSGKIIVENDIVYILSPKTGEKIKPLLKLDDVTVHDYTLMALPTTSIKSIKVLKEPHETTMYGREGASGVVVVETKKTK